MSYTTVNVHQKCDKKGEAYRIAALVLFCTLLFLPGAFYRDLWTPDEPRYAEIAREMVETGQWIVPHLNFEVYHDKPPLHFWLVALCAKLFGGFSTLAAMFPAFLAGTGTVLLTYMLGKRMFGNNLTGFLGGIVLATGAEYLALSSMGRMDAPLTFFETVSIYCFWQWHIDQKRAYLVPFYIGIGLAVLTKGPVALLPLVAALIYLAVSRQGGKVRRMGLGLGLLGVAAMTAAWLVPAAIIGGEAYWKEILGRQIFGRVYNSWSHKDVFYYYFEHFPWGFMPWFVLLIPAVIRYAKDRSERTSIQTKFLVTWFLTIFIFFTLISGKREVYILPLYPACALFVAKYLADIVVIRNQKPIELRVCFGLLFASMAVCAAGLLVVLALPLLSNVMSGIRSLLEQEPLSRLPTDPVLFATAFVYMGAMGVSGLLSLRARTFKPALVLASCFMLGTVVLIGPLAVPYVNQNKSAMPLGNKLTETRKGTEQVGMYGIYRAEFTYYTKLRIETIMTEDELDAFLKLPGGAFCIIREDWLRDIKQPLPEGTVQLGTFPVGHRMLVLLYNPPDGPGSGGAGTSPAEQVPFQGSTQGTSTR